jgi:preprotein translocase subunit SecF
MIYNSTFDWVGKRYTLFALSGVMIGASLLSIVFKGFHYGIDFTGGTVVRVAYQQARQLGEVRSDLEKAGYPDASVQNFGSAGSFAVYLKAEEVPDAAAVETFAQKFEKAAEAPVKIESKEFVGPAVGRHLKRQALTAVLLALGAIIIYVAIRFDNPVWGMAGVVAILHDVVVVAGLFSLAGLEVDLVIFAAILTIGGWSINDTIVIYDRMREYLRTRRGEDVAKVMNDSINDTLSRTLTTSTQVLAVSASLFFFGGRVIHNFALALLVGTIIGTYSSVAIAMPVVYEWIKKAPRPNMPQRPAKKNEKNKGIQTKPKA